MWWSTREAAEELGDRLGMDRESARRALVAGVAGEPEPTRGAFLYSESAIEEVVARASQPLGPLEPCCAEGVIVGRLTTMRATPDDDWRGWRGASLAMPLDQQLTAASGWWRMSAITVVVMRLRIQRAGFVPFVGTVSGFALLGAEIVGLDSEALLGAPGRVRLELEPAGAWFASVERRRLDGPSGSPWYRWPRPASIDS